MNTSRKHMTELRRRLVERLRRHRDLERIEIDMTLTQDEQWAHDLVNSAAGTSCERKSDGA
jgi:hypothetical protein